MRRGLSSITAVAVTALAFSPSYAGEAKKKRPSPTPEKIAVVDLMTEGVAPDAVDRFEGTIEDGLRGLGYVVVPHDKVDEKLLKTDVAPGCDFGPCINKAGPALGVQKVLVGRIIADGPSYNFVLTIVDTKDGRWVAQVTDACAVCTVDEAVDHMTISIVSLGTGTGGALLATEPKKSELERRHEARRKRWGLAITGAAAVALIAGGALLVRHDTAAGWTSVGVGGGLAAAGFTLYFVGP